MLHFPRLPSRRQKTQRQIITFRGVNYGNGTAEGQLEDSRNLSSEQYPCMSPRGGRERLSEYTNATAVYYKNGLFVVDGTELKLNGVTIGTVSPGAKQFASINNKTVIYPDQIYYDSETGKVLSLAAEYSTDSVDAVKAVSTSTLAFRLGNYYTQVLSSGNIGGSSGSDSSYVSDKKSLTIAENERPFDSRLTSVIVNSETGEITFSATTACPYAGNISSGMLFVSASLGANGVSTWGKVTKVYYTMLTPVAPGGTATGEKRYFGFDYELYGVAGSSFESFSSLADFGFAAGDTVEITGVKSSAGEEGASYTIRELGTYESDGNELSTLVVDDGAFAESGALPQEGVVTIKRKSPALTVVCESQNRIWGAEGNTIYASALGDPTNFYTYDGLDTDSYAVAVASEGAFTGCIGYGKTVLFFKEDCLHKLMGDYPSEYYLYTYNVPGVLAGSESSLWNINETVYYHGREGVYRYSGGSPELISEVMAQRRFDSAAAGADGERYYISMRDRQTDEWGMWVYDIPKDLWLQEDGTKAVDFAKNGGELFYIDGEAQTLVQVNPESSEEAIGWSATLCRMDETVHNRKCYSRLCLRGELLSDEAWMQVEISCDGEKFQRVYTSRDKRAKTLVIPILPRRCDSFRIRLSGEGPFILRSLVREYDVGSEY